MVPHLRDDYSATGLSLTLVLIVVLNIFFAAHGIRKFEKYANVPISEQNSSRDVLVILMFMPIPIIAVFRIAVFGILTFLKS